MRLSSLQEKSGKESKTACFAYRKHSFHFSRIQSTITGIGYSRKIAHRSIAYSAIQFWTAEYFPQPRELIVSSTSLELHQVTVVRSGMTILDNITATIPARQLSAVVGPNGAGKSTLLHAMLGLIPYRGRIVQHSHRGSGNPTIGYVPQRLEFDRGLPMTVLDFLILRRQQWPLWFGRSRSAVAIARGALHRVAATHLENRPLGKLSGGELQRVQLALALEADPEILFLDEPASGIDVAGERLFLELLAQLRTESRITIVMVSHDLATVAQMADHVLCLRGRLEFAGSVAEVKGSGVLEQLFGSATMK